MVHIHVSSSSIFSLQGRDPRADAATDQQIGNFLAMGQLRVRDFVDPRLDFLFLLQVRDGNVGQVAFGQGFDVLTILDAKLAATMHLMYANGTCSVTRSKATERNFAGKCSSMSV